jgi:hypothetical protein
MPRVTEALPWLPFHFPEMNWKWPTSQTKARDRQNRLAYVALLASDVAKRRGDTQLANQLRSHVAELERSRLANEDTLAHSGVTTPNVKTVR